MKYLVLWYVALLLVLIMSWSIRCSWKEQISTLQAAAAAHAPVLPSQHSSTLTQGPPLEIRVPSYQWVLACSAKTQQKKDSQSQQCSCTAGACSPETALWSLKWFHIHHHKIYIVTYSHSHFTQSLNPGDLANGQGCNSFVSCRPGTYVSVSIWSGSGIARTPATLCKPGDAVTSL